ncbi:MAG: hypothetical protein JNL95_10695 [Chitinophagales bacterium]|nr:hypothetical protein [Chitinophagales bacterium]
MKRQFFSALFLALSSLLIAQNQYQYQVDLINVSKDQVKVSLSPPRMDKDELVFIMPRVIPGSYSIKDYGRFIKQFTAYDKNRKKLKTKQKNTNEFYIYDAQAINKIEYLVNDTWDDKDKKKFVFQPGGSNIEAGLNYVINPHCFFGYFDGFKMNPFQIEVKKPSEMYGSGNLTKSSKDNITDIIVAPNYVFLADNPMMYCVPDTTSFQVAAANIHISVYSVNGIVKSKKVAEYLQPVAGALKEFLKDLPVSEYHFLYYFDDPDRLQTSKAKGLSGGYGALEHNHSSFYYLPESRYEKKLIETVKHVSSHEFLHLVTPLNLHSEEIEHFDFLHPKMSKHLWMYEGVTEYFSYLAQIRGDLISEKDFRSEIRNRLNRGQQYGNFSMTAMSSDVLSPSNQKLYSSVYTKGALIALLLDIRITQLTEGKKTLLSVMMELSQKYGTTQPFKDEQLFDDFIALTHPKIGDFINAYIIGQQPLPYSDLFKLGWDYSEEKRKSVYFCGYFGVKYDEKNGAFAFAKTGENVFGLLDDDILLAVNEIQVTTDNFSELFEKYLRFNESAEAINITINRNGTQMKLHGIPRSGTATMTNYLGDINDLSESQKMIRKAILNK